MTAFFNKKQLCERWGISYSVLESWIADGLIIPVQKGGSYFSPAAVEAAERVGLSPAKIKPIKLAMLEQENTALRKENEELMTVINQMTAIGLIYRSNTLSGRLKGSAV